MRHERLPFPAEIRITLAGPGIRDTPAPAGPPGARLRLPAQSPLSWTITFGVLVLLVAAILDQPVRAYALSLDPALRGLLRAFTAPGNAAWPLAGGLAALAGLWWMMRRETGRSLVALRRLRICVLFLITAVALSGVAASLAKNVIGRARPLTADGGTFQLSVLAFEPGWASFPSGHATTATAMMVCLALIWPRHGLGFAALGLLMALTRCLLGVHWLSDVIAGVALGVVATLALRRRLDGGRRRPLLPSGAARLCRHAFGRAAETARVHMTVNLAPILRRQRL